ncbi:MAG: hypothetical protein AAF226_02425 [Verrucomicrobiota bacterium]
MKQSVALEWRTKSGNVISGDVLKSNPDSVTFLTGTGEQFDIPRATLSDYSLKVLKTLEQLRRERGAVEWPKKISSHTPVHLTGGPQVYRSKHFEIVANGADRKTVLVIAMVLEDTLFAITRIPTGLDLKPPAPSNYFKVRLMHPTHFAHEYRKAGIDTGSTNPTGVYVGLKKELWLALGGQHRSFEMISRTIMHEVAHQSMDEWLLFMPKWFHEGFAEYISSVPYRYRSFNFDQTHQGLAMTLLVRFQKDPKKSISLIHPSSLVQIDKKWTGSTDEYLSAMMLVYFLIHLDGKGEGASFSRYVNQYVNSRDRADLLVDNLVETAQAYNNQVLQYQQQVQAYQRQLADNKSQFREGRRVMVKPKPGGGIVVGDVRTLRPPSAPQTTESSILNQQRTATQFIATMRKQAFLTMLEGRSVNTLADDMKAAFAEQGYTIEFSH